MGVCLSHSKPILWAWNGARWRRAIGGLTSEKGRGPHVYADMGDRDADTKQIKAFLAGEIVAVLNRRNLTVRAAAEAMLSRREYCIAG